MMKKITIGVDVGGTNVKLGLVDDQGRVFSRSRLITKSYSPQPALLINAMADGIHRMLQESEIKLSHVAGIGIGLPGLVDPLSGHVIFLPNIPKWRNIPLRQILQKKTGLPVFLDNDVNVITLGEWQFGAGQGTQNMIGMTLGTGVGAGLILNGLLYRGPGFAAGELGHMPINLKGPKCTCPSYACLESYVGNQRLIKRAVKRFRRKDITLEMISDLAGRHDPEALAFWKEVGLEVGSALVGVVNLLNPEKIVIGGGIARSSRFFFPVIRQQIRQRAMPVQAKMVRVVKARLGDDTGLVGAGVLVKTEIQAQRSRRIPS